MRPNAKDENPNEDPVWRDFVKRDGCGEYSHSTQMEERRDSLSAIACLSAGDGRRGVGSCDIDRIHT